MKLCKLCPNLTLSHPDSSKWTVCRAAGYSVCVRVCVCPVGVSVWPLCLHLFWVGVVVALPGLGAGARAQGGWQQWWAVRTTRGRLAHREQRRGGELARAVAAGPNRTATNRWKSPIQERNTMHLRTLSERHTHTHVRIPASLTHAGEMHPVQNHTQTA